MDRTISPWASGSVFELAFFVVGIWVAVKVAELVGAGVTVWVEVRVIVAGKLVAVGWKPSILDQPVNARMKRTPQIVMMSRMRSIRVNRITGDSFIRNILACSGMPVN